jgi:hypothetical protein
MDRVVKKIKIVLAAVSLIAGTISGWVVGLVVYRLVAVSMFAHPVSSADIEAMGFWLAAATAVTVPFAHLPILAWLNHGTARPSVRAIRALILGILLSPLAAAVLALMWSGGKVSAIFTPETALATVWAAFIGAGLMAPAAWFGDTWSSISQ